MIPRHIQQRARLIYQGSLSFRGPYIRPDGRRFVSIRYNSGKTSTTLLSRFKMTVHKGRPLKASEHVDHRDDDKTNDSFSNLQILTLRQNSAKASAHKYGEPQETQCAKCGKTLIKSKSRLKPRTFCSSSCRSLFYGANQFGNKLTGYNKTKRKV